MSSIAGTNSGTSGTLGDAPPVSFPGVSSGIDYNAIIEKYTADTLQQEKPAERQINNLNAQNVAILKITSLLGAVQDTLTTLSDHAAIAELNRDTVAPKVTVGRNAVTNTATSQQSSAGGVLFGNYDISRLRDQLVQLVSGFIPSGSNAYNSVSSVGIRLDTSSQTVGAGDGDDTSDTSGTSAQSGGILGKRHERSPRRPRHRQVRSPSTLPTRQPSANSSPLLPRSVTSPRARSRRPAPAPRRRSASPTKSGTCSRTPTAWSPFSRTASSARRVSATCSWPLSPTATISRSKRTSSRSI